jgi:hypothetical protein
VHHTLKRQPSGRVDALALRNVLVTDQEIGFDNFTRRKKLRFLTDPFGKIDNIPRNSGGYT